MKNNMARRKTAAFYMNLTSDEKAALYARALAAGYRHLSAYLVDRGLGRSRRQTNKQTDGTK